MFEGERLESAFCQLFVFIPFDVNFVGVTLTIQIEVQFQGNFRKVNGSWDQTLPRNDFPVVKFCKEQYWFTHKYFIWAY